VRAFMKEWRQRWRPVDLLRTMWIELQIFRIMAAEPGSEAARLLGETSLSADGRQKTMEHIARYMARLIDWLTTMGLTPPSVPPRLAAILQDQNLLQVADARDLITDRED
jgi:hypothetical protein